jgi:hypothetical protein
MISPLRDVFSIIYVITPCTIPLNVSFRRALVGDNWDRWLNLVGDVLMVNLNDRNDSFIWTANKNFSVKNMYNAWF